MGIRAKRLLRRRKSPPEAEQISDAQHDATAEDMAQQRPQRQEASVEPEPQHASSTAPQEVHAPSEAAGRKFLIMRVRRKDEPPVIEATSAAVDAPEAASPGEAPEANWSSLSAPPRYQGRWSPKRWVQVVDDLVRHRMLTLTVESGVVRIVVFQGKHAIAWGTANPDDELELPRQDMGTLDAGYALRLHPLLTELKYQRMRLVTELPLYSPLVRHIQLPRMRERYMEQVVTSEVLDTIPFALEDVDIVWQRRKDGKGHSVIAVATPKTVVDNHVRVLKEASFKPAAAYPRAAALASAAGVADAVIAYVLPSEAGIVLVRDNLPKIVHRLDLPRGDAPLREQVESLAKGIEQVAAYEQQLVGIDQSQLLPVVLTGQLAADGPLIEAFRQVSQRELLPFAPPIVYPEHFPPAEYAVNIGLALADRARRKSGSTVPRQQAPSVNLLSERHLPQPLPFKPIGAFATILLFGAVAFNATTQVNATALEAASLSERVDTLEQQARVRRLNLGRVRGLEESIETASVEVDGLTLRLDQLQARKDDLIRRLEAITGDARPTGLSVSSVTLEGSEFALAGTAPSFDDVIQYTANLRAKGPQAFSSVRILRVTASTGVDEGVVFHVKANTPPTEDDPEAEGKAGEAPNKPQDKSAKPARAPLPR